MFAAYTIDKKIGKRLVLELRDLKMVRELPGRTVSTMFSALYLPAIVYGPSQVTLGDCYITIHDPVLGKFRIRCLAMSTWPRSYRDKLTCFAFALGPNDKLMFSCGTSTAELVQRMSEPGSNEMSGWPDSEAHPFILDQITKLRRIQKRLTREHHHFEGFCEFVEESHNVVMPKYTLVRFFQDFKDSGYKKWRDDYGKIHFVVRNTLTKSDKGYVLDVTIMGRSLSIPFTSNEISFLRTSKLLATFILCPMHHKKCKLILQEYIGPTESDRKLMKIGSLYQFLGENYEEESKKGKGVEYKTTRPRRQKRGFQN